MLLDKINIVLHNVLGQNFSLMMKSITLFLAWIVIYSLIKFLLGKQNWSKERKNQININTRNFFLFSFLILMLFLWGGEIKTLFISTAAIAAAMIVAFKEIILCFMGSLFITSNKLFALGDYIEYEGLRGKVVDRTFVYTKIVIQDAFQNKEITIPNLQFITNKIINLSRYGKLQSFTLNFPIPNVAHSATCYEKIEEIFINNIKAYESDYHQHFQNLSIGSLFEPPEKYFLLQYNLLDSKNIIIKASYLANPLEQLKLEQILLKQYLTFISQFNEIKEPSQEKINEN